MHTIGVHDKTFLSNLWDLMHHNKKKKVKKIKEIKEIKENNDIILIIKYINMNY